MSQTARPPEQTAQTTATQTTVSGGAVLLPAPRGSRTELDCPLFADEGTEGEAAEGAESAEALEKGSRAVSNPRPQAPALCRQGQRVQSWLKDTGLASRVTGNVVLPKCMGSEWPIHGGWLSREKYRLLH